MRSTRQQWPRARPTTASPARACITILVITLRTFSIPTVTVSKRSTRAGNTANHRASKSQRAPTCADTRIVTRSPMAGKLIIYGATGYAGQLVSEQAKRAGLDFIVAGRDAEKVRALAEKLGVPYRVFSVDDAMGLRSGLDGCVAILNCAGPFARTAR